MAVFAGSRYKKSYKRVRGNREYLTNPKRTYFNPARCTLYQMKDTDTIDGLAYKFYGNANLWWCIMDANREFQSELEVKPGVVLQIPMLEEVRRVVS